MKIKAFKMNGEAVVVDVEELLRASARTFEKMSNEISKQSRAINKKHEKLKIAERERDMYKTQCDAHDKKLDELVQKAVFSSINVDTAETIKFLNTERDMLILTLRDRDNTINILHRQIEKYERRLKNYEKESNR